MICGYQSRCPWCNAPSAAQLNLEDDLAQAEDEIVDLKHEIGVLKAEIAQLEIPTSRPDYDDATELWSK
jgi:cell division protein FtsB